MTDLFKTGLLVTDLEAAMQDLSAWLGLSWTAISQTPLVLRTPTGDEAVDLRFAYSTNGAPYLELLEAQPSGYYAARQGPHLHHVGRWVSDLAAASHELAAAGLPLEAAGVDAEGNSPAIFCFHQGGHGVRVELVEQGNRANFEAWLAGGALEL